eukprot:TRINITY_DN24798_c0_g3_i1.p2 TRINITY_DN24798_c0_g3~~TRINITY_DN24798_c0_g3_i1.p2  ORF type:complete len:102 (-),score=10.35 TRINITY_DN24798_c0_g3_i1:94-357(-)
MGAGVRLDKVLLSFFFFFFLLKSQQQAKAKAAHTDKLSEKGHKATKEDRSKRNTKKKGVELTQVIGADQMETKRNVCVCDVRCKLKP